MRGLLQTFGRNPYFENQRLVKEYDVTRDGLVVKSQTPVQWKTDRVRFNCAR